MVAVYKRGVMGDSGPCHLLVLCGSGVWGMGGCGAFPGSFFRPFHTRGLLVLWSGSGLWGVWSYFVPQVGFQPLALSCELNSFKEALTDFL